MHAKKKTHMNQHTITIEQLHSLVAKGASASLSARARERLGWIMFYAEHGHSVSATCTHFDISRGTFHRWLERFDAENLYSLEEQSHAPHTVRQSNVSRDIVTLIRGYREQSPHLGKERITELLNTEHQIVLSSSTVGRIIDRECLYFDGTPHHWKKRLQREGRVNRKNNAEEIPEIRNQKIETNSPSPVPHASCAGCLFCRLRSWNWRPLLVVSVFVNIAVLALFAFGLIGTWRSEKAEASKPAVSELHSPLATPASPHDGR